MPKHSLDVTATVGFHNLVAVLRLVHLLTWYFDKQGRSLSV